MMPTSYTADVQDGTITTLPEFAMRCARNFGALLTMRDAPLDAPIPDSFEPDTAYHDKALADAQASLAALLALTPEQAEHRAFLDHEEKNRSFVAYRQDRRARRDRYEAMLEQVRSWSAPSEVASLKKFMVEQLVESIRFDCGEYGDPPNRLDGTKWREKHIAAEQGSISYHTGKRADEIARVIDRNRWLKTLRDSLGVTP